MKINGANALNANIYRKINMRSNINVYGKPLKDCIKVSDSFTKSLKGKSDQEKREEVLRFFIRNHKINSLEEKQRELVITSESGIELSIDRSLKISKEVLNEILEKYYIDRMNAYEKNDAEVICINGDGMSSSLLGYFYDIAEYDDNEYESSYHVPAPGTLPKELEGMKVLKIVFGFKRKNENIELFKGDREFFDRMLEDVDKANFEYFFNPIWSKSIYKCVINGEEKYIVIDSKLFELRNSLECKSDELRLERKKYNSCQYKMEEFKNE